MTGNQPASGDAAARRVLAGLAVLLVVVATIWTMLLSSGQMFDARVALPSLSEAMGWLEGLDTPFDMDHVAFFTMVAALLRILLPKVRWWVLLVALGMLAVGTELLQFFTVGRTPKALDARDDLVGACLGLLVGAVPLWCAGWTPRLLKASDGLLLAGFVVLPIELWSPASALGFPLRGFDLLLLAVVALRGFTWAGGRAPPVIAGFHAWLAGYVLAMLLAVFVLLPMVKPPLQGMVCPLPPAAFSGGLAKWVGVAWLALIAAAVADAASRPGMPRRLAMAWLAGACVVVVVGWAAIVGFYLGAPMLGWVQPLLSHYGSLPPGPYPRIVATFANANMLGLYLLLSVGVLLASIEAGWLRRSVLVYALAGLSLPLLATASPAIGASALLLALWSSRRPGMASRARKGRLLVGAGIAMANLALLVINPAAPFAEASVRVQLWQQAWSRWMAHPWRGSGLDQPAAGLSYVAPDGSLQYLSDAHSIALNLAAQGGVLALAGFAGLVAWVLVRSRKIVHSRWLWLSFLLAVGYLGIGGSFEDARVLWAAMGLLVGAAMACTRVSLPPACADDARATA